MYKNGYEQDKIIDTVFESDIVQDGAVPTNLS